MCLIDKKTMDHFWPVSFDEFQRYKIASLVLEHFRTRTGKATFNVLEVGANSPKYLRLFLPGDKILFTDIELSEEMRDDPEFQAIDGTDMPFDDGSFDFVIATDVLEHIPSGKRECLLREAIRVAKYAAIITFPYASQDVMMAERRVNAFYKAKHGEDYIWLKEHSELGLPQISEIDACLQNIDCCYFHTIHGDITLWETMYYSFFDAIGEPNEWDFRRYIDQFYISNLFSGDTSDNCYRAFYVLTHEDSKPIQKYLLEQVKETKAEKNVLLEKLFQAQHEIHTQHELEQISIKLKEINLEGQEQRGLIQSQLRVITEKLNEQKVWQAELVQQLENGERMREELIKQVEDGERMRLELIKQVEESSRRYQVISEAFFWKISKPIRVVLDILKGRKKECVNESDNI